MTKRLVYIALLLPLVLSTISVGQEVGISDKESRQKKTLRALVIDATAEEAKGNIDKALDIYKECLRIDKMNPVVHFEMSKIYKQMSDLTMAVDHAEKAVEFDNQNLWFKLHLAELYAYTTLYKEAALVYEGIAASSNNPDHIKRYAELLIHSGDYVGAINTYGQLEHKMGHSPEITRQKSRLYFELGQEGKAIQEINDLIIKYPRELEYLHILALVYENDGDITNALSTYQKLLSLDVENALAHLSVYKIYWNRGDTLKALDELKFVFSSVDVEFDKKIRLMFNLYETTFDERKLMPAVYLLLEKLIETHHDKAPSYTIYGDFLMRDDSLNKASQMFIKSLEYDSDKFMVWQQIMLIDQQLGNYKDLLDHSNDAIERFPNQPAVYYLNGIAHYNLENHTKAISILHSGKSIVIEDDMMVMEFYHALGDAYYRSGNHPEAYKNYDEALKIDPENLRILNNYAYYLSLDEIRLSDAEKMILGALKTFPDNTSYLDTYGWILFKQKKYSAAKQQIEKAIKNAGTDNGVQLEHLGDVLFHMENISEALIYWKKAKEAGRVSDKLEQKINTGKYID